MIKRNKIAGYRKEQLRVQLTTSRILKISGERPIGENKWRRFNKEFGVPSNCDTKEITAKFEGGILYIRQPKVITPQALPLPLPQPPQQELPPPMPQPRQEVPPPMPQPQQEVPPTRPPQPQQQQEEKMEKCEYPKKDEGGKDKCEFIPRPKQVVGKTSLFNELIRPENFKRLLVCVILVLSFGFYMKYMFSTLTDDVKEL